MIWLKKIGLFFIFSVVVCNDDSRATTKTDAEDISATKNVVIVYTEDEFKENVEQKAHFIMFYAPW